MNPLRHSTWDRALAARAVLHPPRITTFLVRHETAVEFTLAALAGVAEHAGMALPETVAQNMLDRHGDELVTPMSASVMIRELMAEMHLEVRS